jgi:hypothetical protein
MIGFWNVRRKGICGAVFFVFVLSLSGCGNFNQSIEAFIDDQTGTVALQGITPGIPEAVVREDGSVCIPPAAAGAPEFTLELSLRNKQGYALDFAVLNTDGTEPDPAVIRAESGHSGQIFIHIAGARPGDAFNLTLKLWKAGGRRSFDDIVIPPVIFELPLPADAKAITGFILEGKSGTIDEAGHAIAVVLPRGTGVTALVPVITYTGVSIDPGTGVARDFSVPQTYTVTAADGSTRSYTVTVTAEPVYAVTIMPAAHGTVTASVSGAVAGEPVTLTFTPDSGYMLTAAAYTYGGTSVPLMPGAQTITMPAAGITVTAEFTATGSYVAQRGTTSYTSLKDAIDAAPPGSAGSPDTITLLQSIVLPEGSLTSGYFLNKHIRLVSGGSGANAITRKTSFTSGSLFTVNPGASLTLEGSPNALVVDGNNAAPGYVWAGAALITVDGGILNVRDGVVLRNNWNTGYARHGGGVCVNNGGRFTLWGTAKITGNKAAHNGGGVYVNGTGSRFEMQGGTVGGSGSAKNAADNGGGVLVSNDAFFVMTGGSVTGNTATHGGGVYMSNASFTMTGGSVTGNAATGSGGGVCLVGPGSRFDMQGGTIGEGYSTRNTAPTGNGVYVETGTFDMSGGSLRNNGVHVLGKITMKGGARVIDDWIYLGRDTFFITLTGDLTGETPVAVIYPQNTAAGTTVLAGTPPLIPNNRAKFYVDIAGSNPPPPYPGLSSIDDDGKLK